MKNIYNTLNLFSSGAIKKYSSDKFEVSQSENSKKEFVQIKDLLKIFRKSFLKH